VPYAQHRARARAVVSGARRRVVHLGRDFARAACGAWLGDRSRKTEDVAEVTCAGCLAALADPTRPRP